MAWFDDNDDDFWGEFTQDYSGGTDKLFDFGINPATLGGIDSGSISNLGFRAEDFGNVDFGNLGSILNIGMSAEDLGNVDFGNLGALQNIGFRAEDLGNVDFGFRDTGLSYTPDEDYGAAISSQVYIPQAADDVRAFFGELEGEGYGTGVLPGGGSTEDIRQFFGDVSGQTTIPSWAREGVDLGFIKPNYDGTYTMLPDDTGSTQVLDYKGNVVRTITSEGLEYDQNGIITSGPRTGQSVTNVDIKGASTTGGGAGAGAGGGKGGDSKGGGGGGGKGGLNDFLKDNKALLALLGGILGLLSSKGGTTKPSGYKGGIPKYTATRGTPTAPTAEGRRPGGAGIPSLTGGVTYTKAAGGGLMDLAQGGRPARYLRGGTDGMADKIKTDIDGKQPARLSHGEFVIPADVVSHLGNGNSDAGADVLYDMMDKVRKARTGTTKQGKQINPRKMLPA